MDAVLFYLFAALAIGASLAVVGQRNPMYSVLMLIGSFIALAGLYIQLDSPFVAVTQIIVYAGAIMVLFVFVVMMLDINLERLREGFWQYLPLGALVGALMAAEMSAVLYGRWSGLLTPPRALPAGYSNTKALGRLIYTDYLLAFEIAAVVLLVAIIAAIALTLRQRKDSRSQDPAEQVRARREDRVRLVSMASAKDD